MCRAAEPGITAEPFRAPVKREDERRGERAGELEANEILGVFRSRNRRRSIYRAIPPQKLPQNFGASRPTRSDAASPPDSAPQT